MTRTTLFANATRAEVRYCYRALEDVEDLGQMKSAITETIIRTVHGLVMKGQARPTRYRDGQNVIRDSRSGRIDNLRPEANRALRLD